MIQQQQQQLIITKARKLLVMKQGNLLAYVQHHRSVNMAWSNVTVPSLVVLINVSISVPKSGTNRLATSQVAVFSKYSPVRHPFTSIPLQVLNVDIIYSGY